MPGTTDWTNVPTNSLSIIYNWQTNNRLLKILQCKLKHGLVNIFSSYFKFQNVCHKERLCNDIFNCQSNQTKTFVKIPKRHFYNHLANLLSICKVKRLCCCFLWAKPKRDGSRERERELGGKGRLSVCCLNFNLKYGQTLNDYLSYCSEHLVQVPIIYAKNRRAKKRQLRHRAKKLWLLAKHIGHFLIFYEPFFSFQLLRK